MYDGLLRYGGVEVLNAQRTYTYANNGFNGPVVRNPSGHAALPTALGHSPYSTPAADAAPWYNPQVPESADFYGAYPIEIEGLEDSSRTTVVTELLGNGASHSMPRYAHREVRLRVLLYAKTEQAMYTGMAWFKDVLGDVNCVTDTCGGTTLEFFTSAPSTTVEAGQRHRTIFGVEAFDGPTVKVEYALKGGYAREVEVFFSIDFPFAYSDPIEVLTTSGLTGTSGVAEVACPGTNDAYSLLVEDPNGTPLARPPAPPTVGAPAMPATWWRYTGVISTAHTGRGGSVQPIVTIDTAEADRRNVRIRFYRDGWTDPCDFVGEFYIPYQPLNTVLTIDPRTREVTLLTLSTGLLRYTPYLVVGSAGRPPTWPDMSCDEEYEIVIDSETSLGSDVLTVDVAYQE